MDTTSKEKNSPDRDALHKVLAQAYEGKRQKTMSSYAGAGSAAQWSALTQAILDITVHIDL